MSLIFSRQCDYALQAVLYLALKPDGEMTAIRELAAKLEIPPATLARTVAEFNAACQPTAFESAREALC